MIIRRFDKVRNEDLWQRANQNPINIKLKRGNGHGLATDYGNHQAASPDRPLNGTHKAKEAEDDQETPGVGTQSQN